MRLIGHDEAMALYDYAPLIEFMDARHRLPPARVAETWTQDDDGNGLLARTGLMPGSGLGIKLATVFPGNIALPTVHTVYVLFDPTSGVEQAVIASNALTWFKTACDSGLAAMRLARADAEHLVMVGAGSMAPHLIKAHRAVRPSLERVTIWNRSPKRARLLADTIDLDAGVTVEVAHDLRTAVEAADVVSIATMAVDPLVHGEWLQPGTHVDAVGAYKPDMREVDDVTLQRARIFVDSRDTTLEHIGELKIPLDTGVITEDDVLGDHYELASGEVKGRTADDQITFFKNGGGGHLDLMAAQFLLTRG